MLRKDDPGFKKLVDAAPACWAMTSGEAENLPEVVYEPDSLKA